MVSSSNHSFLARCGWFVLSLWLGIVTANSAMTLTISGIPGDSTIPGFSGAIDVTSMSHGIGRAVSITKGGVMTSPSSHSEISFTKQTDSSTPLLYDATTHGGPISSAELDFMKSSPDTTVFYKIILDQVYVTSMSTAFGDGSVPEDGFSLFYEKITWSYLRVDGGRNTASWDRVKNTGTNNLGSLDSDGDGLPDTWEMQYFGNLGYGANDDPDHDGLSNYQEYLAGTNPNDANSVLRVTDIGLGTGQVNLTWTSVAGKTYTIYSADKIDGPYTPVLTVPSAGDGQTSTNLTGSAANQFYKVGVP
jgi:type VI secretion system Hcp family effector